MATIADLKTPWGSLSSEEKMEIIKGVRRIRLQIKPPRTKTEKKRREVKSSQLKALNSMSDEQLDILLKRLEEKRDGRTGVEHQTDEGEGSQEGD